MDAEDLQQQVQVFIRRFGLLDPEKTPCGRPMTTSQAHALQVLGQRGQLTQQELAGGLYLDKSTVSRLVAQLEKQGWVQRAVNPNNRREVLLLLSPRGRHVLEELRQAAADRYGEILARIAPEKRPQVLETLKILNAALGKD